MDWLAKAVPQIRNKTFLYPEFNEATKGLDIEGMVYLETDVNPAYGLLETQWVVEKLAKQDKRLLGVVAYAPLENGERSRSYVEALVRIGAGQGVTPGDAAHEPTARSFWSSSKPKEPTIIKGVRRLLQSESVDFCVQPDFIKGVQLLADYGLSFDICVKPWHLANAIKLVEQCPGMMFVLDHMGKPQVEAPHAKDKHFAEWSAHITKLASFPNVYAKLSGITTEVDAVNGSAWTVADLQPYFDHYLKSFGEDRIMFGGDWPVVLHAEGVDYKRWVDIAMELTANLSHDTKMKIFNKNAKIFYRL
eukprot:TRINITY_DN4195_c0_g1_i9.p1 TRINITY_DN4195_c0_g1~~TRINITY_DN4195_c0_g1_i9.p1  ORF type:complete len:305 (+),score=73.41 TRINITY_DN4195_c0_g1_i9:121-1035(+)